MLVKHPFHFSFKTMAPAGYACYNITDAINNTYWGNCEMALKKRRMVARVKCKGNLCNASEKTMLEGVSDCALAAESIGEDSKACSYGCLGYGSCAQVCPFGAIDIVDGIALVDKEKCKGCRKCVKACPRLVIEMVPYDQEVAVDCNSKDFGKAVKEKCKVGCIGCQMCVRACPFWAIEFKDNLAYINYDKCTNCKICAEKCPTKAITALLEPRKKAEISEDKCIGCTVCAQVCPVFAIDGNREEAHRVNPESCIGCGYCAKKCPMDAITMI